MLKRILLIVNVAVLIPLAAFSEDIGTDRQDSTRKESSFTNPITPFDWPDPTIWKAGKTYFSAATGLRCLLKSEDLYNWSIVEGKPLITEDCYRQMKQVGKNFWAPDVVRIGRLWMMYVTCYNSLEDCGIVALHSRNPDGPFEFTGLITHSTANGINDTIDPEVVVNKRKVWMILGSTYKIFRVRMNSRGTSIGNNPHFMHVAGRTIVESPHREKSFEGSYLHFRDGYWYFFVSSGRYYDDSYCVKVGRSKTLDGEFIDRDGNKMKDGYGTIILSSQKGDILFGPGHNGEIISDSSGQDYIFYHCHNSSGRSPRARPMLLQRIFWDNDGWPYFINGKPAIEEIVPDLN